MNEVEIIRAIQSIHTPLLDRLFGAVTNLHHETVYILVLPVLFWLYDKRFARYMFSVFALGFWSNDLLKSIFASDRPDPNDVRVLFAETTHGTTGFPSGHSQTPLIFWGAIALHVKQRWFWWFAGILTFLIGFSRLYLGLHWLHHVLGGWIIGAICLAGLYFARPFLAGDGQSLSTRLLWSVLLPAGALAITALVSPHGLTDLILTMVGAYMGLMVGSTLEDEYVGFDPRKGTLLTHVLKMAVGLTLMLAVKEGLKPLLPDAPLGTGVRYFLVAMTATFLAPWLFHRFLTATPAATTITRG